VPPPYPDITAPLTPTEIESALSDLAATFPGVCTREKLPFQSHKGSDIHAIKIANVGAPDRPTVVLVGGVHGRESAPPDALVRFAQHLLVSHKDSTDILYPMRRVVPLIGTPVSFPTFKIRHPRVKRIVERVDLWIAPCVNPDGRLFDQDNLPVDLAGAGWRKNLRPNADAARIGVDINRNFDIAWRFEDYYNMGIYRLQYLRPEDPAATDSALETFRGPVAPPAGTEPETANVQFLVNDKRPRFYVDVHQAGRMILIPWGLEQNGTDPAMRFDNAAFTAKRDGLLAGSPVLPVGSTDYQEFLSDAGLHSHLKKVRYVAEAMQARILRSAGLSPVGPASRRRQVSTYRVLQSSHYAHPTFGPATGVSDDYAFSRQFLDPTRGQSFAYTLETGNTDERGFHPNYAPAAGHYQKIEREIHAALIELLAIAAGFSK
jgi:Zinc carboxypeptidase